MFFVVLLPDGTVVVPKGAEAAVDIIAPRNIGLSIERSDPHLSEILRPDLSRTATDEPGTTTVTSSVTVLPNPHRSTITADLGYFLS